MSNRPFPFTPTDAGENEPMKTIPALLALLPECDADTSLAHLLSAHLVGTEVMLRHEKSPAARGATGLSVDSCC